MRRAYWIELVVLSLCACEEGSDPTDAGGTDAVIAQDADPEGCATQCGDGLSCLRGVCIDTCGDAAVLDAALGEDVVPIAGFCRTAGAFAVRVMSGTPFVWDVNATTEGLDTEFTMSRWELDPEATAIEPMVIGTVTHSELTEDVLVFAGGSIAVDPPGGRGLFGYTTLTEDSRGELYLAQAAGAVMPVPAPGNFDVAWLDSTHFIVNGMGLGGQDRGQGLYVGDLSAAPRTIHLAFGPGDFSGSVENAGAFILAGGVTEGKDGALTHHVYAIPKTRADATITGAPAIMIGIDPNEASEVLDQDNEPISSTFVLIGSRIVLTPYGGPMTSYAIDYDPPLVRLNDPRVIAADGTIFGIADATSDRMLLSHAGGLLLVE
jgi:hypothetical protein